MSYYKVLSLQKEPFSTSPDPSLLYLSRDHHSALMRLRISVKLKRGLSLLLGDVGAGKTTLSRRFAQLVSEERRVLIQMMLNPFYGSDIDFLQALCDRFTIPCEPARNAAYYFSRIESYLFQKGVEEGQTVVLLIDEAQTLSDSCLEALRVLLNYETNEHKILQLILVSQLEIVPRLQKSRNFWDRISLRCLLRPLNFEETRRMIRFRLQRAGYHSPVDLFSEEALGVIYRATRGSPRQITQLCHDCLECLVMYGRNFVDGRMAEEVAARNAEFSSETLLKETASHGSDTRRAVI